MARRRCLGRWLRTYWFAGAAAISVAAPATGQSLLELPEPPEAIGDVSLAPADPLGDSGPAALTPELRSILDRLDALEQQANQAGGAGQAASGASADQTASKAGEKEGQPAKAAEKKSDDQKEAESEWVDMSGDKWAVKLAGHIQMDWINWPDASPQIPAQNYMEFRRVRLVADGTGYGVYDFRLQIDIEPEAGDGVVTPVTDMKDAYFSANDVPLIDRWRIGNFFVPFSLEQVTNDTQNVFVERSIPTQGIFAADREVGWAFYSVNDAKDFTLTSGVFFDSISESLKERIDDNQGTRLSTRVTWLPYYDEPGNGRHVVHLGAGVLFTDDQDNQVRFRARPQIHEGPFLIDTGNVPASDYLSSNLEAAVVWGSLTVQSEWFLTGVNRAVGDPAILTGGYAHVSYFLTGENRVYERYGQHGAQFTRNQPYTNFFIVPGCCGWGAWELKARYSHLNLEELDAGQYNDFTVGFNHYWSDRIRVMFDWIHPVTSAESLPFGDASADVIAMRFDFNW